jgi:hypothetical protein
VRVYRMVAGGLAASQIALNLPVETGFVSALT